MENLTTNKKYISYKFPFIKNEFFTEEYKDFIIIFIIQKPLFVVSSLNQRIKQFTIKNNQHKSLPYEDIFENDKQVLKEILNDMGFQYNDDIFNNTTYRSNPGIQLPSKKPIDTQHGSYRTWQINQEFKKKMIF